MKVLVTGGAGYIGSHTIVQLINAGHQPVILDDFRNSEKSVIFRIEEIVGKEITYYNIDIGDAYELKKVIELERPEGVIHFAADKAVGESVENPLKYYKNNIVNLINLLDVIKGYDIKSFVFSSSCTVYGTPNNIPVNEKAPMKRANSPYGYTKVAGERILTDFFKNKETNLCLLRYFNPVGAHPSGLIGELPVGVPNNLIPYVVQVAAGIREELTIHGGDYETPDGTCIRDYIHVMDLADSHVKALEYSVENKEDLLLNIGTGNGSSVLEIINEFEKVNNIKIKYKIGPRREGDVTEIFADNSLIVKKLGWQPKYSLADSLKDSWNWQKNLSL